MSLALPIDGGTMASKWKLIAAGDCCVTFTKDGPRKGGVVSRDDGAKLREHEVSVDQVIF